MVGSPTVKSVKYVKQPVSKLTILERILEKIRKYGILIDVKRRYIISSEDEKTQIEDIVVWFMNKYNKALIELQGLILDSLYDKLEARWKIAIKQDKELFEFVLMHLQPETSREDIQ